MQGNTLEDSRFLVLTGASSVSRDSVLEWFPVMTGRQSIFTVQDAEWTKGTNFNDYVRSTHAVQKCLSTSDVACLDKAVSRTEYDYTYISKVLRVNNCNPPDFPRTFPYFLEHIRLESDFENIYETDDVVIFSQR